MKKIAILGVAIAALLMTGTLAMALPLTGECILLVRECRHG